MSLWDSIKNLISRDQEELVYARIPRKRQSNPLPEGEVEADVHYFRLTLVQMLLQKKSKVLQVWYPAVHSMVKFGFGGEAVEVANLADTSRLLASQDAKGDIIARNFTLVPLMPFKGGDVSLTAGLFAVPGENHLKNFVGVMSEFAALVAVPQLSSALTIADPLANGIQTLFGGNGGMHLGFHDTFVGEGGGDNVLAPRYFTLIRATEGEVNENELLVINDQLRIGSGLEQGESKPFDEHDFMLIRMEVLPERDDWNQLTSISAPFEEAVTALADGDQDKAKANLRNALVAAIRSPELTKIDRRRVVDLLKRDFKRIQEDLDGGFESVHGFDFSARMASSALSIDEARELGEPGYDEVEGE